jgi:hypothetical protein
MRIVQISWVVPCVLIPGEQPVRVKHRIRIFEKMGHKFNPSELSWMVLNDGSNATETA